VTGGALDAAARAVDLGTADVTGNLPAVHVSGLAAVATSGSASDLGTGTLPIARIAAGAVTYAKIQNVTAHRVLGNPTGAPAAPSELSLGANMQDSGGVLNTAASVALSTITAPGGGASLSLSPADATLEGGSTGDAILIADGGTYEWDFGIDGSIVLPGAASPFVSQSGHANVAYDNTAKRVKVSIDTAAYQALITADRHQMKWSGALATSSTGSLFFADTGSNSAVAVNTTGPRYTLNAASTVANLRVFVDASGSANAVTLTVYKNGGATALTVSLTAGTTGAFSDLTHTVSFAAGDDIALVAVLGGGTPGGASGVKFSATVTYG
jgi:hypothetical protein